MCSHALLVGRRHCASCPSALPPSHARAARRTSSHRSLHQRRSGSRAGSSRATMLLAQQVPQLGCGHRRSTTSSSERSASESSLQLLRACHRGRHCPPLRRHGRSSVRRGRQRRRRSSRRRDLDGLADRRQSRSRSRSRSRRCHAAPGGTLCSRSERGGDTGCCFAIALRRVASHPETASTRACRMSAGMTADSICARIAGRVRRRPTQVRATARQRRRARRWEPRRADGRRRGRRIRRV